MDPAKEAATRPPRRSKKWLAIPVLLLVAVLAFLGWAYVRGTSAERAPRNPTNSAEGVIAQILEPQEGIKQVRLATVVDFPLEEAWAVITDYDHFGEIFPH